MKLPASISPPSPGTAARVEHAPEADECPCDDCHPQPQPNPENPDVND
jgi:hypothetical protein